MIIYIYIEREREREIDSVPTNIHHFSIFDCWKFRISKGQKFPEICKSRNLDTTLVSGSHLRKNYTVMSIMNCKQHLYNVKTVFIASVY